jgi:DNA ligase (NAD+)
MEFFRLSHEYLEKKNQELTQNDIEVLASILEYHSDLYYNKQSPIISDFEYDMLFKKLQFLEEKFQISEKNTHKVGSELTQSTFEKVKHSRPMISLDNTYNEEDLRDFDERVKKNIKTPPNLPLVRGGTQIPLLTKEGLVEVSYITEFKFDGL